MTERENRLDPPENSYPWPEDTEIRSEAVWRYYINDEGKARWRCSQCGKLCRRHPNDKRYCSNCGAKMRMEA